MAPRRSRLEIHLEILAAVKQGMDKPTRIMYAVNMSWKPVQRILSHLLEQGFLAEVINIESKQSKRRRYQITEKGEKIIDYFEKAKDIMLLEDIFTGD